MANARAHVIFSGRVQGVFFRVFTEEVARSLGLTGWVRNVYDGNVEAVFEGEKEDVQKAIRECRHGPPASRVDDMEVSWEEYRGEFSTFSTRFF
jgi:acylphosphatase